MNARTLIKRVGLIEPYLRREQEQTVKFLLEYDGPLRAATDSDTKIKNKNELRWRLSSQLGTFFQRGDFSKLPQGRVAHPPIRELEVQGRKFKFLPVIWISVPVMCELTIQIKRRENPGGVLTQDGDLDNRVKTIFDALRMPKNESELR